MPRVEKGGRVGLQGYPPHLKTHTPLSASGAGCRVLSNEKGSTTLVVSQSFIK